MKAKAIMIGGPHHNYECDYSGKPVIRFPVFPTMQDPVLLTDGSESLGKDTFCIETIEYKITGLYDYYGRRIYAMI